MGSAVLRYSTNTVEARFAQLADALSVPGGGFTIKAETLADVKGRFSVATFPECERKIGGRVFGDDVMEYILDHAVQLRAKGAVAGGWRDRESGIAYLDVSRLVYTRQEAERLAREHNQRAYWDFAAMREVYV